MSRPTKPADDLSDAEKRDLVELIQQNRTLPDKYRFILFDTRGRQNEWQCFRTRQNRKL